jgi:protein arginine N-methyltransferase 1
MYTIPEYGWMMGDRVRMEAYTQALRRTVKPGSVVLDIGTGTGIFAVLACQFGARIVYALEPDEAALEVARDVARQNECGGRIEFIQELSTRVTLCEKADVIISDLRGVLPLFQQHLPAIVDARRRLLKPDGALIPQVDRLWAGIVEVPALYELHIAPWNGNGYGVDTAAGRRIVTNTFYKGRLQPEQLLAEPTCWGTLDYAAVESPNIEAEIVWTAARAGSAHGLGVWFDTTLADGVGFSNAPGAPEAIYAIAFFPWAAPVGLATGDVVTVGFRADLIGQDYVWRWETRVLDQGRPGQIKAQFKQSTFPGSLSSGQLRKLADKHVPSLTKDGEVDRFILELMDGERSLGEIAHQVVVRFPEKYDGWREALTRVGELSRKYS